MVYEVYEENGKKIYAGLLALCQDLDIDVNGMVHRFREPSDPICCGKQLKIKDLLFGDLAIEIEKISLVVNNLYLQASNFNESNASRTGYLLSSKMAIVKRIAETYEALIIFFLSKSINPEKGFLLVKGEMFKLVDEEIFFERFSGEIKKIRESYRILQESMKEEPSRH